MRADQASYAVIDFESTGVVSGFDDEPWQVAVVPVAEGRLLADRMFESYIRVDGERPFNPCAPGSWRLVRDRLAAAPCMHDLLPELSGRLRGVVHVAHNVSTEKKILRRAWPLHRFGPWVDTLALSRMAYPGLPNHRLETVIEHAGLSAAVEGLVPGRAAHDALYDAAASAVLLCHLLAQEGWRRLTVNDLAGAKPSKRL